MAWDVSFRWALRSCEVSVLEPWLSCLATMFFCTEEVDACIWKPCPSEVLSVKSFYQELEGFSGAKSASFLFGDWPPLGWRLSVSYLFREVVNCSNLRRGALSSKVISILCSLCGGLGESVDHFFPTL